MKIFWLLVLSGGLISLSCNSAKKDDLNLTAFKVILNVTYSHYRLAVQRGDSIAFVSFYSGNACINPPNAPKMCGKEAIGSFFNSAVLLGTRDVKISSEEVMKKEDWVVETGSYEVLGADAVQLDIGKYIVVWKEHEGEWKIYRGIWNSNNELPPAQ